MIEQLARTSAEELRSGITSDSAAGLADLHVRQARRHRQAGLAAAAAVVLAVGVGVGAGTLIAHQGDRAPTPTHPPSSTAAIDLSDPACIAPHVTCLGDRTYRYALVRPVVWALPPGFGANAGGSAGPLVVENYRREPPTAGVTVLERVRASAPDGRSPATGVADDPRAFVHWIASRPFLDAGPVRTTTLDGHAAWQVRVTLAPGAPPGRGGCTDHAVRCHPLVYQEDGWQSGIFGTMSSEYTAVRLPGAGTTVVWSWIFSHNPQHLGTLEEAVHSISWPVR